MSRQAMPVQKGVVINYKNTGAAKIAAGDVVPLSTIVGIAETDIEASAEGTVNLCGVWEIAADATAAFSVGDFVYWDAANKKLVKTTKNNNFVGIVVEAKASAATKAFVKIGVAAFTVSAT